MRCKHVWGSQVFEVISAADDFGPIKITDAARDRDEVQRGRLHVCGNTECHVTSNRGAGESSGYVFSDVASVAGDSIDVVRGDRVLEQETDEVQARGRRRDTPDVNRAPVGAKRRRSGIAIR